MIVSMNSKLWKKYQSTTLHFAFYYLAGYLIIPDNTKIHLNLV